VIPIVNENDTISVTELMFTDNDELSGLIATMMDAQILILLSNVDGIYITDPSDPNPQILKNVKPGQDLSNYIRTEKSGFGRGGMLTKTNIAHQVAEEGIAVVIANGRRDDIITDIIHKPDEVECTRFEASQCEMSNMKRWIAHSAGFAKGELHLNTCATKVLSSPQATSILPVGVERVEGEFEKDDIVRIIDCDGKQIGVGRIACDSAEARNVMGQHGQKPLVHYDYLCLE
jgi:glutamate 5-kinase